MTRAYFGLVVAAMLMASAWACGQSEDTAPVADNPGGTATEPDHAARPEKAAQPDEAPEPSEQAEVPFAEKVAESQPLAPNPQTLEVDFRTLTPVRCTLEGVELLTDNGLRNITRLEMGADGKLYVLNPEGRLIRFTVAGDETSCTLTLDTSIGQDGLVNPGRELKEISIAGGKVYASSGVFEAYRLDGDLQPEATCSSQPRHLVMAPDGSYGIAYFANTGLRRITWTEGGCNGEDWTAFQSPFSNVNVVGFIGGDIAIGGVLTEAVEGSNPRVVVVTDAHGREKLRFGNTDRGSSEDRFGWVHAIEPCRRGICVLDSNYRRLTLWNSFGRYKGFVDLRQMFDLRYPWIPDFEVTSGRNAFAWFTAVQERGDSDVYEGLIYRVSGL